jgi:hypothetical protein
MDREDVIELGVATEETKGPGAVPIDEALGQFGTGLSDD